MHIKIDKENLRIGIISDTHGQIRKELFSHFKGVEYLLHAGDIGSVDTLRELERIAPVCAVLGNTDSSIKFPSLSQTAFFETAKCCLCVTHDYNSLDFDPGTCDIHCLICGHTHVPAIKVHKNVLYINPGSAGPRRFDLPVTIATLEIRGSVMNPKLINLSAS